MNKSQWNRLQENLNKGRAHNESKPASEITEAIPVHHLKKAEREFHGLVKTKQPVTVPHFNKGITLKPEHKGHYMKGFEAGWHASKKAGDNVEKIPAPGKEKHPAHGAGFEAGANAAYDHSDSVKESGELKKLYRKPGESEPEYYQRLGTSLSAHTEFLDWAKKVKDAANAHAFSEHPHSNHHFNDLAAIHKAADSILKRHGKITKATESKDLKFAGYEFTSGPEGTKIKRDYVQPKAGKDYGSDPLPDGRHKMVPSGDVVDGAERDRRLGKK